MNEGSLDGTAIRASGLRSVPAGKSTVPAVDGLDLEVKAGEIFGFLGPNGAGKTTALRLLATLLLRMAARRRSRAAT